MAPERALVAQLVALVDVLADLHGPRSETFAAAALETPNDVGACSVPAHVPIGGAFVLVQAAFSRRVQGVPRGAFAAEGAVGVDACPSVASVWH